MAAAGDSSITLNQYNCHPIVGVNSREIELRKESESSIKCAQSHVPAQRGGTGEVTRNSYYFFSH